MHKNTSHSKFEANNIAKVKHQFLTSKSNVEMGLSFLGFLLLPMTLFGSVFKEMPFYYFDIIVVLYVN